VRLGLRACRLPGDLRGALVEVGRSLDAGAFGHGRGHNTSGWASACGRWLWPLITAETPAASGARVAPPLRSVAVQTASSTNSSSLSVIRSRAMVTAAGSVEGGKAQIPVREPDQIVVQRREQSINAPSV